MTVSKIYNLRVTSVEVSLEGNLNQVTIQAEGPEGSVEIVQRYVEAVKKFKIPRVGSFMTAGYEPWDDDDDAGIPEFIEVPYDDIQPAEWMEGL